MSRGAPIARHPDAGGRPVLARRPPAPLALPPPPSRTVFVGAPVQYVPVAPQAPPPPPPVQSENALDGPAVIAMAALGAAVYWAFLREPERAPQPTSDPFSNPCPYCNPLVMLGTQGQPMCEHQRAQAASSEEATVPTMAAPTIVVVGGGGR